MPRTSVLLALALALSLPASARAAEPTGEKPKPAWLKEKHMIEVGWLMGALFPARDHGLYGVMPPIPPRPFKIGFDIGLRFAYLPLRFIGLEIEGDVSPTKVDVPDGKRATLFGFRGHVLLQLPTRLTPFLVAGGGMLGASSQDPLISSKTGGALHIGGGLKIYVSKYVAIRFDGRDIVMPGYAQAAGADAPWVHHGQFTIGAAFVWGRKGTKMWPRE